MKVEITHDEPSAEESGGAVYSFIASGSERHADATAVIDWGWARVGPRRWETPSGEVVSYLSDVNDLRSRSHVRLWLGFDWFARPAAEMALIAELERLGRLIYVEANGGKE